MAKQCKKDKCKNYASYTSYGKGELESKRSHCIVEEIAKEAKSKQEEGKRHGIKIAKQPKASGLPESCILLCLHRTMSSMGTAASCSDMSARMERMHVPC